MAGWIEERGRKFVARWRDEDGRKRSEPFDNRDDAEAWLLKVTQQKRSGTYQTPSEITVRELVASFLMRARYRVGGATIRTYTLKAEGHIYPVLGGVKVRSLTTVMVQDMIDRMLNRYAPATVVAAWVVLHAALDEAVRLGIVPSNRATGVGLPVIEREEQATWTFDEVRRVLAAVRDDVKWHALYALVLASGMRPGEALVLRWGDVDLDAGVVHVRRTRTSDADGRLMVGKTTKGKRVRAVAIGPGVVEVLRRHREDQQRRREAAGERWRSGDAVFDGVRGPLGRSTWGKYHTALIERAGVRYVTPHGMRHTNATLELQSRTPTKIVSERLGHKHVGITLDIYSHVDETMQREAANVLDSKLFGD